MVYLHQTASWETERHGSYNHCGEKIDVKLQKRRDSRRVKITTKLDGVNSHFITSSTAKHISKEKIIEEIDQMEDDIKEQKKEEQEIKNQFEEAMKEKNITTSKSWLL